MRWKEPEVKPTDKFQFRLEPWRAARATDIENPGLRRDPIQPGPFPQS